MITPSQIDRDTTADDLLAIRRALGIVGFTLEQKYTVFVATATSVPVHARITRDDVCAVGVGIDAASAVRRAIESYAERAHWSGRAVAS